MPSSSVCFDYSMEEVERECPSPDILEGGENISKALMSRDASQNLEERLKAVESLSIDTDEEGGDDIQDGLDFVPETEDEEKAVESDNSEDEELEKDECEPSEDFVPETEDGKNDETPENMESEESDNPDDEELKDAAFEATRSNVFSPIFENQETVSGKSTEVTNKSPKRKSGKCPRRAPEAKKQKVSESPELCTEEEEEAKTHFYMHPDSKLIFRAKERDGAFSLCHTGNKIEKEELFQFEDNEEMEKNIQDGTLIKFNMKKRIKNDLYMVTHEGVAIVTQYADGGALGGHAIADGSCDFWNVQKSSGPNKYYEDVRVRLVTSKTWLELEEYQIEEESYGVLLTPEMDPSLKIKLIESVNKDEGIYWSEKDQENIIYFSTWDKAPISEICWRVICKVNGEKRFYSNRKYFEEIEDPLNFLRRYIPVTKN